MIALGNLAKYYKRRFHETQYDPFDILEGAEISKGTIPFVAILPCAATPRKYWASRIFSQDILCFLPIGLPKVPK